MSSKFACSFRCIDAVVVIGLLMLTSTIGHAFELNPAAVIYKLPDQIEWKGTGGNRNAVLVGEPEKPGLTLSSTNGSQVITSVARIFIPTTASSPCSRARGG